MRQGDLVARYGGEEFVLLIPGATDEDAIGAARRVREVLRGVPGPRPITASLGIACLPDHGVRGADLLAAADQALYAAKEAGRDQARLAGREGPVAGGGTDDVPAAVPVPRAPEAGALQG
jgi:two-component system cell cycle response regulator